MGKKNAKTLAVVLIVLLFGYYQQWVFVFIYELIASDEQAIQPQPPRISLVSSGRNDNDNDAESGNQLQKIKADIDDTRLLKSKSDSFLDFDNDGDGPNPYFHKEAQSEVMSAEVQHQLNVLQNYGCQPNTILCGAPVDCELGCQVHHLMTCLMISFSLNATLIPDFSYWPYSLKWNNIFESINPLNCQVDNATISVVWSKNEIGFYHGGAISRRLKVGLPITRDLSRKLKATFSNPFLWWAGQFANFTLSLQPSQLKWIEKTKQLLQFSAAPVVGILLRRRDKKGEKRKPFHSIDKHFIIAKNYYEDLEMRRPNLFNSTRRVYIATDDMSVLKLARKRYRPPKWEIFGAQRKSEAEDIMKDIYLLSACDFVVCNFSSDICRLVAELMNPRKLNATQKVKSLNSKYSYQGKEVNKLKFIFPYLFPTNFYFIETYNHTV